MFWNKSKDKDEIRKHRKSTIKRLSFYILSGLILAIAAGTHVYAGDLTKVEISYKNGKKHKIVKEYYPSGVLWREAPYVNGEIHGEVKIYDESGNLM